MDRHISFREYIKIARQRLYYVKISTQNNLLDLMSKNNDKIVLFNPSISTNNTGDEIIAFYCQRVLSDVFGNASFVSVPTHILPDAAQLEDIYHCKTRIVCGTNILSPDFDNWSLWEIPDGMLGYNQIVTLGVGWGHYSDDITRTSKYVYNCMFSKTGIHSVRDSYTEKKMKEMGIHNVLNTGCPTLWALTPEFCKDIPTEKANNVVTTVTSYSKSEVEDGIMLNILSKYYRKVYIWLQGRNDYSYLKSFVNPDKYEIVDNTLEAYNTLLDTESDLDYIGTRLHGGIHALNHKKRTWIIGVDNRALEMQRDFNIPVIRRSEVANLLAHILLGEKPINIKLPVDNIESWKKQFK